MGIPKNRLGSGPLKTFAESNENFPSGMQYTAKHLKQVGFTPGLWFMPFSGDMHNPYFPKEIFAKHLWSDVPYDVKNGRVLASTPQTPQVRSFYANASKEFTIGDTAITKSTACIPVRLQKISM